MHTQTFQNMWETKLSNKDLTSAKNSGIINDKLQFWYHDCKSSGPTQTERGFECNDCGVTEDDVETIEVADKHQGDLDNFYV